MKRSDAELLRFEALLARFFDGVLSEGEDRELAALLDSTPAYAERFRLQIEVERFLITHRDPARITGSAFVTAVRRGVALDAAPHEARRFASSVLERVHVLPATAPQPAPAFPPDAAQAFAAQDGELRAVLPQPLPAVTGSQPERMLSRRRRVLRPRNPQNVWLLAGAAAAVLAVGFFVLVAQSWQRTPAVPGAPGGSAVAEAAREPEAQLPDRTVPAALEKKDNARTEAPLARENRVPSRRENPGHSQRAERIYTADPFNPLAGVQPDTGENPGDVAVREPAPPKPVQTQPGAGERGESAADGAVAAETQPGAPRTAVAPASKERIAFEEVGRLTAVQPGTLLRRVNGGEKPAQRGAQVGSGDLLVTPAGAGAGALAAEVLLNDGTRMQCGPDTRLRFDRESEDLSPLLERGALRAIVAPQRPEHPLVVRTPQGQQARVVGTVFRMQVDAEKQRVALFVEEGKVQFGNAAEKRMVAASESSVAEGGKAPSVPALFRPRLASISGLVLDRETNQPVSGADVAVVLLGDGMKSTPFTARTDALGRYSFDALPEGPLYVHAAGGERHEEGGMPVRAVAVRGVLRSGEKQTLNLRLERAPRVDGRVNAGGKALEDYRIHFVRPGSDGQALNTAVIGAYYWILGNERQIAYTFTALDGPGRYTPVVEKRGFVAKVRSTAVFELRGDRNQNWTVDVTLSPSAEVRGRVSGANGAALTEDLPGPQDPTDPFRLRTRVTLRNTAGTTFTALAAADGSFAFDTNIEPGNWELRVERPGWQTETRALTLAAGKPADVTVALKPSVLKR